MKSERRSSYDPTRNGQFEAATADLEIVDVDDRGVVTKETVTVKRILDPWPLDRMHRNGTIDDDQFKAGEMFRDDYERSGMAERIATNRLSPTASIRSTAPADRTCGVRVRRRVADVLASMSNDMASALEFVVGNGHSVAEWVQRARCNGKPMNDHFARGLLVGALDVAALVYGLKKNRPAVRRPAAGPDPEEVDAIRTRRAAGATILELQREFRLPPELIAGMVATDDVARRVEREAGLREEIRKRVAAGADPTFVAASLFVSPDFVAESLSTEALGL